MTVKEFETFLRQGLGRCYLALKSSKDVEKYKETVLKGCLRNLSFDAQFEPSRAFYSYNLAKIFNDDDYFISACVKEFENLPQRSLSFSHLAEVLQEFANDGSAVCEQTLKLKYEKLYLELLKKTTSNSYDYCRDNFEALCTIFSRHGKLETVLQIITDLGLLFIVNPIYNACDFDYFLDYLKICPNRTEIESAIISSSKQEGVKSFIESYKKNIEPPKKQEQDIEIPKVTIENLNEEYDQNKRISTKSKIRFINSASVLEKIRLAVNITKQTDIDKINELLSIFTLKKEVFPIDHKILIDYYHSNNEDLSRTALTALTRCKSQTAKEFAFELLERKTSIDSAILILLENFSMEFKDLLLFELEKIEIDLYDTTNWCRIHRKIIKICEETSTLPKEFLLYVYNKTLCSSYRERAVKELSKLRALPYEIIKECLFDSNEEIRIFINKTYPL